MTLAPLIRRFLVVLVAGGALASARPAPAADQAGAEAFIAGLGQQAIQILQAGADAAVRTNSFRQLFRTGFDIPTIGQFVLGRYWPSATVAQQQEYLGLFEDMIVQTYARRFSEYSGETLQVAGSRPEGDRDVMVRSSIVRPNGPPVEVVWRVRDRGGSFQIVDVLVEGVSMGLTQRNEFSSIIQRNGGNIDALLTALRQQVAAG